jgi:hypothetical protein
MEAARLDPIASRHTPTTAAAIFALRCLAGCGVASATVGCVVVSSLFMLSS